NNDQHIINEAGLGQGSLYIQRLGEGAMSRSRATEIARSALVNYRQNVSEAPLLEWGDLMLTNVSPMQTIYLGSWTDYYHPSAEPPGQDDVTVLIEASRPSDLGKFLQHEFQVPPESKIHLMSLGTMEAWHSGTPFGILVTCSPESLVTLAIGLVDNTLTLEEDLETEGRAGSLFMNPEIDVTEAPANNYNQSSIQMLPDERPMKDKILASFIRKNQDQVSDMWSNESLASTTDIAKLDMLSELASVDGDNVVDGSFLETGSGEGLSEFEAVETSSVQSCPMGDSQKLEPLGKPPNVLIYTGKIDSVRKFDRVKKVLEQCLDVEKYVIYHLKHEDIDREPWIDNTILLVLATKKKYQDSHAAFMQYFMSGGRILGFGSGFDTELLGQTMVRPENWITQLNYGGWTDVSLISGSYVYDVNDVRLEGSHVASIGIDKDNHVSMAKVTLERKDVVSCAILSQVLLDKEADDLGVTPEIFNTLKKSNSDRFEILTDLLTNLGIDCNTRAMPVQTPAVLLATSEDVKAKFFNSIKHRLSSGVLKYGGQSLLFTEDTTAVVENSLLPVLMAGRKYGESFSLSVYKKSLGAKVLGNTVFFMEVVPTTMTILDGLLFSVPDDIGRGGNAWLSPIGCAMFSLHVRIPQNSNLGQAVSYLQHITSLAVVNSVCNMEGYEDTDLRLKWPNDIYYGHHMKLGGVIVKSTIMDGIVHATIGCGFNVDNSNPTICINDIVDMVNKEQGTQRPMFTTEQLIARTVTEIEALIGQFQKEGVDSFRKMYYDKWLHSDRVVRLESENDLEVTVRGLDDFGYLLVETDGGEKISVQPDGNSFDMMRNLICLKQR
ncbi:BPL1-like protein, partial [Mya arenaria]